mgnify:CR=1 FL=1
MQQTLLLLAHLLQQTLEFKQMLMQTKQIVMQQTLLLLAHLLQQTLPSKVTLMQTKQLVI